jgi:hypothetical protein
MSKVTLERSDLEDLISLCLYVTVYDIEIDDEAQTIDVKHSTCGGRNTIVTLIPFEEQS